MTCATPPSEGVERASPWCAAAHCPVARTSLSGLTWLRIAEMPSAVTSRQVIATTRPSTTATMAGPPFAVVA